jgi:alpha-D-ribose 1-methylphosphonate 5-triphosphate synthase subunit PhnG
MTTHDRKTPREVTRKQVRDMLARAKPEQLKRLLDDIRRSGQTDGGQAA